MHLSGLAPKTALGLAFPFPALTPAGGGSLWLSLLVIPGPPSTLTGVSLWVSASLSSSSHCPWVSSCNKPKASGQGGWELIMLGQGLAGPRTVWSPSRATYLSGFVICDRGLGKQRGTEDQEGGK